MHPRIIVVLPAYNAATTLKSVYRRLPKTLVDEIILVDDGSQDSTVAVAKKLGITTFVHKINRGYGANQKTCYREALKRQADFIIMLHPDSQYDPKDLSKFIQVFKTRKADLVLGSRFLAGGDKKTPLYKSISIRIITLLFNLVLGTHLSEANTGYRGFSRGLLQSVPWHKNGNSYIFDPQMIIQAHHFGFKIVDVPIFKDYHSAASSPNFAKSLHHGLENLQLLVEYLLHQFRLKSADFLVKP